MADKSSLCNCTPKPVSFTITIRKSGHGVSFSRKSRIFPSQATNYHSRCLKSSWTALVVVWNFSARRKQRPPMVLCSARLRDRRLWLSHGRARRHVTPRVSLLCAALVCRSRVLLSYADLVYCSRGCEIPPRFSFPKRITGPNNDPIASIT